MKFPPSFSHVLCIADDKDADVEDEGQQDEEEDEDQEDIFELEGTREALQLDPSKFQDPGSESAGQSSELGERVTGRSGFEGKATDEAPSTSGREQVLFCLPPNSLYHPSASYPSKSSSRHLDQVVYTVWRCCYCIAAFLVCLPHPKDSGI